MTKITSEHLVRMGQSLQPPGCVDQPPRSVMLAASSTVQRDCREGRVRVL